MEQYIPKSALVAEIKSRISDIEVSQKVGLIKKRDAGKKIFLFKSVLSLVDTLNVKEVDLDAEVEDYIENTSFVTYDLEDCDIKMTAKHFFELGLKAQKGE